MHQTWLCRLLCGMRRRSNSQNIKLIMVLKGYKMSFFSNQLIYNSIKRGRRTAIKKLNSDGLIGFVKWHQEFIKSKFILNGSILLSILWACPSWIRKVSLVPNEAKLIIVVIDRLPWFIAWTDAIQPLTDISWIRERWSNVWPIYPM